MRPPDCPKASAFRRQCVLWRHTPHPRGSLSWLGPGLGVLGAGAWGGFPWCLCECVCVCVCVCLCICVCECVCLCVFLCVSVCVVYISVCVCVSENFSVTVLERRPTDLKTCPGPPLLGSLCGRPRSAEGFPDIHAVLSSSCRSMVTCR